MLSKKLAQNIVDKMMDVIPYNVNIMNSKGEIIGSGNLSRIGQLHEGALQALRENKIVEVLKDENHIKAGVNIPILFREKIVGVIGITGMPDVVRHFGKLVSVTAELLINQEYSISEYIISEKLKEEFIYEWINCENDYDVNFIERAKSFDVDILVDRNVVAIEYDESSYKKCTGIIEGILEEDEYMIHLSSKRIIILIKSNNMSRLLKNLKEKLQEIHLKIGVGNAKKIISKSVKESIKALDIGIKLYDEKIIYYYEEIKFYSEMKKYLGKEKEDNIIKMIKSESKNGDLLETFLTFMECNGERAAAAKMLHIHRNTLNYRLEKIEEITCLRFDNYVQLFQLIKSYLNHKLY